MGLFRKKTDDDAPTKGAAVQQSASPQPRKQAVWNQQPLSGVKKVIAVGSGKGGVGKSTTTVMLAHALSAQGLKVGILDADIYGPSIPRMLGLRDHGQPQLTEEKQMIPPEAYGIRCNSMGFLMGVNEAAVWRGPMITKALNQLARLTQWAPEKDMLDLLLIDLPPGTGDIHLSMIQQIPLDGAVLVTTPQEVAIEDARRCAEMFRKVRTPLLGIVENMSWFADPQGQKHQLFGAGGGEQLATELEVPLLADVPMMPELVSVMDKGQQPSSSQLGVYISVVKSLLS